MKEIKIISIIISFNLIIHSNLFSENYYRILANLKARPMAMGATCIGIPSGIDSILYNPASYVSPKERASHLNIFLIYKTLILAEKVTKEKEENDEITKPEEEKEGEERLIIWIPGLLLAWKSGLIYPSSRIYLGYNLFEEGLPQENIYYSQILFDLENIEKNYYHSIIAGYRISSKLSFGITFSDYHQQIENNKERGFGINIGIFYKISPKCNIGINFIDLSNNISNYRLRFERFVDEAINAGVSYQIDDTTLVGLDIRNLNKSNKDAYREFHLALEKNIIKRVALRAGYYKEKNSKKKICSIGIGIITSKKQLKEKSPDKYSINYSIVEEKNSSQKDRFHFLTINLF